LAELALDGGRVIDPASGVDEIATVAVTDGRIESVGPRVEAERTIAAAGLLVVPGLVDLHTHLYRGVSHYGIDADAHCLLRGVTTAVDAGSAGAQTFPGFRELVIARVKTRVVAFLHIAVQGMISSLVGELEDLRWAAPEQAVARAREHAEVVVGVKVRLGYQMVGRDPKPALQAALRAADELDLPLMVHVIDMPRPITWLLPSLRAGDIVTHCYHGNEGGILDANRRVFPEVFEARERGIVFDVGHGIGSFTWRVARAALAQGLPPTTISSDVHAYNVKGPVFDQPTTLSKLLALGMPLPEVVRATTSASAAAIGREDRLGSLAPGREADITVLELVSGSHRLTDGAQENLFVAEMLVPRWVVRAGRPFELTCQRDVTPRSGNLRRDPGSGFRHAMPSPKQGLSSLPRREL
jgi:dihydroorotase